jgi:NAD(P)H-hydrate repair Nnr-like enzyme with NAD(P)H-hydrate dehydratase domain
VKNMGIFLQFSSGGTGDALSGITPSYTSGQPIRGYCNACKTGCGASSCRASKERTVQASDVEMVS